jgi:hypothetical protein
MPVVVNPFGPAFSPAFGPGGWASLAPVTVTKATITGLAANTSYDVRVYSTNAAGAGPPSPILTVRT